MTTYHEQAKRIVLEVQEKVNRTVVVKEGSTALVERFLASVPDGFGLELIASKDQWATFIDYLQHHGLDPDTRRWNVYRESTLQPVYRYEIFVNVPAGWQPS